MAKKQYLKEDGSLDFEKLDLLTEEQLIDEQQGWSEEMLYQYDAREGTISEDEFREYLVKNIFCRDGSGI